MTEPQPDSLARRDFLDARRRSNVERMDTLFAPTYDRDWGHINATHAAFVDRFIEIVGPGADVLDAACGTGKYWPRLHDGGVSVYGMDHSEAMLASARAKYPDVPTRRCALQDLATAREFRGRFHGALCVDALENVGPEDWPGVLAGLRSTLRPHSAAYVTVELPGQDANGHPSDDPDAPLVDGETLRGGSYHYYPSNELVQKWLRDADFVVLHQADGDGYLHLLCRT